MGSYWKDMAKIKWETLPGTEMLECDEYKFLFVKMFYLGIPFTSTPSFGSNVYADFWQRAVEENG